MENWPILSWIIFLPLIGIVPLLLISKEKKNLLRITALLFSFANFVLSLVLVSRFDSSDINFQFVEKLPWISSVGIEYHVGVDGISILLILLTTFISIISIASTWTAITEKVKGFMISFLIMEVGMLGVFMALDLFLFYVFWEVMLLPMYFIIGVWGGARRIYAAIKFVLFTMAGSLLMLLGIIFIYYLNYQYTGIHTFDFTVMLDLPIRATTQLWLFGAFAIAFAIKVPMFPFHTWLPDAHVEAPTAGSIILAGVLLKMGTYGFVRFCLPLFPVAAYKFMPLISILALIGIIYGGLVSIVQKDVKSLVAFSSVAHLGFVMLGIFALNVQGISGSILQMVNHGISTGALFMLVGMIYERRHTRLIEDFGGIAHVMPVFAACFMIIALSSIGLPGTNGFVGEFLILLGMFKTNITFAVLGTLGIIIAAVYMLWMIQRVFFGECNNEKNKVLKDINWREKFLLAPLIVLVFWIGFYPKPFLSLIEPAVENLVENVEQKYQASNYNFQHDMATNIDMLEELETDADTEREEIK
ncbi:MAG: NADH-quinone oxidoreductase subunit M [candidate division Zixibacteria bacterium]|nr:NADH-quinone oxidoreductase subunit M [candidate division Zixibacteria bacterium]